MQLEIIWDTLLHSFYRRFKSRALWFQLTGQVNSELLIYIDIYINYTVSHTVKSCETYCCKTPDYSEIEKSRLLYR